MRPSRAHNTVRRKGWLAQIARVLQRLWRAATLARSPREQTACDHAGQENGGAGRSSIPSMQRTAVYPQPEPSNPVTTNETPNAAENASPSDTSQHCATAAETHEQRVGALPGSEEPHVVPASVADAERDAGAAEHSDNAEEAPDLSQRTNADEAGCRASAEAEPTTEPKLIDQVSASEPETALRANAEQREDALAQEDTRLRPAPDQQDVDGDSRRSPFTTVAPPTAALQSEVPSEEGAQAQGSSNQEADRPALDGDQELPPDNRRQAAVAPEKRGGRRRGASFAEQKRTEAGGGRDQQVRQQRPELVCAFQGMARGWAIAVEVPDELQLRFKFSSPQIQHSKRKGHAADAGVSSGRWSQ